MNIAQNRIVILAVSQYVNNRNNIESWPKYRNTIELSHFCQFSPLLNRSQMAEQLGTRAINQKVAGCVAGSIPGRVK